MSRQLDPKVLMSLLESMNTGVIFLDPEGTVQYCNTAAQVMKKMRPDMVIGKKIHNCHPEHLHEKIDYILAMVREKKTFNWQKNSPQNESFLEQKVFPVLDPEGKLLGIVMIIHDISQQKELTDKLKKSERELCALYKASRTISSSLNLNDVLFKILLLAGEVTNFSSGTIYLLDETKEQLVPMATLDCLFEEDSPLPIDCHAQKNLIAFAARTGEMVTVERGKPGFNQVSRAPGINAVLILPLKDQGKCLGVLVVESQNHNIFRLESRELLNTFANHAALAIRNAQLFTRTKQMAVIDGLTNLYNRQYFNQILGQAETQCKNSGSDLTVMMLDVNDLKFINDYYGHVMGDYILKEAARILQKSVRETDTVCRYGGDEMIILLPNTSESECKIVYKRILENVARWNETQNQHPEVKLSLSIGYASARGQEGLDDILIRADRAMYEDKRRYKMALHENGTVDQAKKQYYSY